MTESDKLVIKAFCEHCNWAYVVLQMRKHLWDKNDQRHLLRFPHHEYFFGCLIKTLQDCWILETAKLMDKEKVCGHETLTIAFVLNQMSWDEKVRTRLESLKTVMTACFPDFSVARNNLLAHNNKELILSGDFVGAFSNGMDETFFDALESFASEVHQVAFSMPYSFDQGAHADCSGFMKTYIAGLEERFGNIQNTHNS